MRETCEIIVWHSLRRIPRKKVLLSTFSSSPRNRWWWKAAKRKKNKQVWPPGIFLRKEGKVNELASFDQMLHIIKHVVPEISYSWCLIAIQTILLENGSVITNKPKKEKKPRKLKFGRIFLKDCLNLLEIPLTERGNILDFPRKEMPTRICI